jgi:ADP-heptose:LPS heptosyltransferase
MHLAAASGVTTIGLFSASDPSRYAPYGNNNRAIVTIGRAPQDVAHEVLMSIEKAMAHTIHAANSGCDASLVVGQTPVTLPCD